MRFIAILNREGGAMRSTDVTAYGAHLQSVFGDCGHEVECRNIVGEEVEDALRAANTEKGFEGVIVAGGDGTTSCAAKHSWQSGRPLAIIPAGTMNLYARSLAIPLDIWQAAAALASGKVGQSDIATANGRPYLHQFSVGFHPRVIRLRNRFQYRTKWGKIRASILSTIETIRRPPKFPVVIERDGEVDERVISALSVSNNPYGEGHFPYADRVDTGRLGIYVSGPMTAGSAARVVADLVLGSWRANPGIEETIATSVRLRFPKRRSLVKAVIDGELIPLDREVAIDVRPRALSVILPDPPAGADGTIGGDTE